MACNADAASPSEAYALLARWAVVLHGFEGRLMSGPAGPRNVRSRTRPAPPRRGPGPGRRRSAGDDPAVRWVPRRSCILKPSRIQGEVEDSDIIVAGIAFILSRARHICMLCDNWPVI